MRADGTYTDQLLAASRVFYIYNHRLQNFETSDGGTLWPVFACMTNERYVAT